MKASSTRNSWANGQVSGSPISFLMASSFDGASMVTKNGARSYGQ